MENGHEHALVIATADLNMVAELIMTRFPHRGPEARRIARMRTLLAVTAELNRTLTTYARHALVHCHGTAGTSDLSADTAALNRALNAFCNEIGRVARDYDDVVNRSCELPADVGIPR